MADIKNLFEKQKGQGILANASLNKVGRGVESPDYVKVNIEEKERFVPYVNFESASNFARYGLAEKYYEDSIGYISNEYPYDGSLKEKIEWNLSSSYLDRYIFENEYPRTTGYVTMGRARNPASVDDDEGYVEPDTPEYIDLKGSPHPSTGSGPLRTNWDQYNLYNTSSTGRYNLEINGDNGFAVEFWWQKNSFRNAYESNRQVVFDLWNSGTSQGSVGAAPSGDWGRFTIEIEPGQWDFEQPSTNQIYIKIFSGSDGFSSSSAERQDHPSYTSRFIPVGQNLTLTGTNWTHYAINAYNTGSQMAIELYVNGALNDTVITGSSINPVTGAMVATIGSLVGQEHVGTSPGTEKGDGPLSASLDEFRYWRRKRTPTQIGQHWFTQVGGGTNSDITNAATASTKYSFENPVDLGVYYKFNEGIYNVTAAASQDAVILDYSGRTTNGNWVGYTVGSRSTGSAIVESSASVAEFKDPIIYSSHPDVVSLRTTKTEEGRLYDYQNNANIYHSYPSWILAEDEDKDRQPLKDLTQILASYFDTLHLQIKALPEIKNVKYPSGSDKPYPFANRLINSLGLVSSEIFTNATDLEYLASKNDFKRFVTKLEETKNNIYQNIYNNLIYIYKSKGTEKSFRNLIRCFGVGEELVNINLYGSDITYELRNNADFRTVKKKYANFHNTLRFDATVFQETGSGNTNSRGYITSSISSSWGGQTYEVETIFPTQLGLGEPNYVENAFVTASIFGCHTSGSGNDWVSTSHITDTGQFQVQSVRPSIYSKDAYFQLTGSGYYQFDQLTSSLFKDVYDDSKWNFAVRIKPSKYPLAPSVSGSAGDGSSDTFNLSFVGYNYVLDKMVNSFVVTSSASRVNALNFLTSSKRFFLGAHRTNFTSSVLQQSDAKISSMRVWMSYLEDETLKAHAQDAENFGSKYPYKSAYMSRDNHSLGESGGQIIVPQLETLVLNWNFDTVTGSDVSGQFIVSDISSGSTSLTSRWGWLGNVSAYQYPGRGWGFPASATGSVSREYVYSSKQQLPETLNSSDMISLIDDTTRQMFTRDSRPIDYSFAFEKSMNAIVSQQMLNYFATIIAFNNLIGEPVNRYRQDYKDLEKLRALYFERVQNTPDFEKFVEFFKWIDMSLGTMLVQLAPASARFSEKLRNVVESHILERNKYWNKFPTLEMKASDPEAGLFGINEMLYPYKRGRAPDEGSFYEPQTFAERDYIVYNEYVGWTGLVNLTASSPGVLYKGTGGSAWNAGAGGTRGVTIPDYITFEFGSAGTLTADTLISNTQIYWGLDTNPTDSPSAPGDMDYSVLMVNAKYYAYKAASAVWSDTTYDGVNLNPQPQFRLVVDYDVIKVQRQWPSVADGPLSAWETVHTFATKATHGDVLYPDITIVYQGRAAKNMRWKEYAVSARKSNCLWWLDRAERSHPGINSGDSTVDDQRNTYRLASDFRSGSGPTLAVSRNSVATTTTYEGDVYAVRNFTKAYRFIGDAMPEIRGGSNFPPAKRFDYINVLRDISQTLKVSASSIKHEKDCNDIIAPNLKNRLEYKLINMENIEGYNSGKGTIFAPFSLFSSSVQTGYISNVSTNFRAKTDITNYHDDAYESMEVPVQGPFTDAHVGGRQARHININTASTDNITTRPEAWNLTLVSGVMAITPPTALNAAQPRAIYFRDELSKRPLNIRNIKWGTSSAVAGNYREDYEMIQTTGRTLNNRFFVDNEGFSPSVVVSPYVSGVVDFALPRYDLVGSNKYIFVNRFNAPGSPAASSHGSLDIYAEEYSVYNDLNYRNLVVRNALKSWQTDHCGQFGISPTGSVGDGTNPGQHMTNPLSYDGVVAAYHKVNRNPVQTCLVKSGYDRYVNWVTLVGEITFNRTTSVISKPGGASTGWNVGAVGSEKLLKNGYLSFEVTTVSVDQIVGLNTDPPALSSYSDMNYSIQISAGGGDQVYIWEKGTAVQNPVSGMTPAVGDIFKIVRESTTVYYQRSTDGGKNFATFYTSGAPSTTDLYPDIALYDAGAGVRNVKISNPQYDNWFVQHAIPQSALQYAWINDSYEKSKDQPLGYVSNYLIPSGTTSMTASAIQFASASDWGSNDVGGMGWGTSEGVRVQTDFANINFNIYEPITGSVNTVGYPSGTTLLDNNSALANQYINRNTVLAYTVVPHNYRGQAFNALMLHRNGPYQYPSWKQTRTGEHPIARYQRRNNILSVMAPPQMITVPDALGPGKDLKYLNKRMDAYRQFIEPPVVFKYKPLDTMVGQTAENPLRLRSSYANNKSLFSQAPVTVIADYVTSLAPGGTTSPISSSITDYLKIPNETSNLQIYDLMQADEDVAGRIKSVFYNEVVYPREANTGLAKTRARTAYAETARVNGSTPPTASLSDGTNGIDRSPLYRRTLWRDKIYDRNRYGAPAVAAPYVNADSADRSSYPWFTTTIPNSCNNKDGQARSVWCFGEEPLVWVPPVSGTNYYLGGNLSASGDYASNNGQDTGELNSINIMKIGGMMGGVSGSALTASFAHQFYTYPSASAFYYWLPYYGDEEMGLIVNHVDGGGTGFTTNLSKGMKWTAATDSGLKPWFDSYEEYAEDIRGLSKAWTVLPEFKISDSMAYYVQQRGGNFRAQNDKFLSLNGASITQSAQTQTNNTSAPWNDGQRNFNEHFFKEYSFSDFQKYFGTFYSQDQGIQEITLKCNAVKKLLPYKGFYPADRTTQLVSLFSGALGQYVTGGAVTASQSPQNVTHRVNVSGSQQLAMQALLQPWFAPGILYNTVKSGIAVDWPVLTGSYEPHSLEQRGSGFIRQDPNTRFPFKSLLDPLDYIPPSASNGDHKLMFLAPSYQKSVNHFSEAPRVPFAEFINPGATNYNATSPADDYTRFRPDKSVLDLYSSAMHNFLAEIPNFFLKGNGLKTIESRPQWSITIGEGTVYVMDVYIQKTNNAPNDELIMIDDYYNGTVSASFEHSSGTIWGTIDGIPSTKPPVGTWSVTASYNGKYFGPIWSARNDTDSSLFPGADWYERWDGQEGGDMSTNAAGRACDPGHAPCTPPYFYGKSRVRLIYTGSAEDAQREGAGKGPNFRKVFNNMTMSFKGVDDPRITAWTKFSSSLDFGGATNQAQLDTRMEAMTTTVAFRNMMDVTASLELKGIKADQPGDDAFNRWIISPLMETPVLDFSESQARELGYGRGMWSGYGRIPENKEIAFGIEFPGEEALGTHPNEVQDMTKWFQNDATADFERPQATDVERALARGATVSTPTRQKVGELAPKKEISEAIVAIPFIGRQMRTGKTAVTIENSIMDKYFFSLDSRNARDARTVFNETKKNLKEQGIAIPAAGDDFHPRERWLAHHYGLDDPALRRAINETSISQMVERMQEYVIPPELDFNQFSDIEPFVMYIIPFKHEFNDQDLADIWQGLMPRISRTAELDTQGINHNMDKWEFFGGKQLPKDPEVRWMVFKVKKQAAVNYFDITPSVDDRHFVDRDTDWARFTPNKFPYAYNWPYDYFSLVELAQIEVGMTSGSAV